MEKISIGSSPLRIAPIAFGGNIFGWTVDEKQSFTLLDAFLDRGFNCIDTADAYSRFVEGLEGGESETIIGNWLARGGGRRDRIVLCTKVGLEMEPGRRGLSAAYIAQAVDACLRRLQTDHIDLLISHRDDPDTPIDETLGAYQKLIDAGKVRAIGASNFSADRLAESLRISEQGGLPRYQSLQPLYNLYDRSSYEGALQQLCVDNNLSVFPFFALASGFLSGKYRTEADYEGQERAFLTRRYLDERGLRILNAMDAIAVRHDVKLPPIALAWLLTRPGVAAPVASATSIAQLDTMVQAVSLKLDADDLARLDRASQPDTVPA